MQRGNVFRVQLSKMNLFGDDELMLTRRFLLLYWLLGCTENGPKTVKLFKNQPGTLDFDSADSMEPIQAIE